MPALSGDNGSLESENRRLISTISEKLLSSSKEIFPQTGMTRIWIIVKQKDGAVNVSKEDIPIKRYKSKP